MVKIFFTLNFFIIILVTHAQSLKQDLILKHHFEKVGNKNIWQQIHTFNASQSYFSNAANLHDVGAFLQSTVNTKLKKTYYQFPNKNRVELYVDGELNSVFLSDDKEAKGYNTIDGYEEKFSDNMRKRMSSLNHLYVLGPSILILSTDEKDIEYEGLVEKYGKNCHKIVFTPEGFVGKVTVYFDSETYLIHASSTVDSPSKYKIYSDYRDVGGITIPYKYSLYEGDMLYEEFKILEVEINEEIDEYIFSTW